MNNNVVVKLIKPISPEWTVDKTYDCRVTDTFCIIYDDKDGYHKLMKNGTLMKHFEVINNG